MKISIHAPLAGSDLTRARASLAEQISIHAPLAGSDHKRRHLGLIAQISIHAPLAGSDPGGGVSRADYRDFNPRSPCGERLDCDSVGAVRQRVQSTLPLRGATSGFGSTV